MTAETMQMNTRISRSLKESGDAALERAGYTPSQAVRKLWSFAARHLHDPQAIQSLLESADGTAPAELDEEHARKLENFYKGWNICAEAYERAGIVPSKFTTEASYDELREAALLERLRGRNLDR